MNTQKLLLMVVGVVVVVTSAYFLLSPYAQNVEDAEYEAYKATQTKQVTEGVFAPSFADTDTKVTNATVTKDKIDPTTPKTKPADSVTPTPTPVLPPAPVVTPSPEVKGYTVTEVALHAGESSCWSIINGKVYDLTSFIPKHPGGERNILKICGKDGTAAFEGQHGGDSKPEATLVKQYLGPVIQ